MKPQDLKIVTLCGMARESVCFHDLLSVSAANIFIDYATTC